MTSEAEKSPSGEHVWTDIEKARSRRISEYLASSGLSKRSLAAEAGKMNSGIVSQVLRCNYPSPPARHLHALEDAIKRLQDRASAPAMSGSFVETSVSKAVNAACTRAQTYATGAAVSAHVGTGKSRCLREYASRHSQVYIVEATPGMTKGMLVSAIYKLTGASVVKQNPQSYASGTIDQKVHAIIEQLRDTQALIALDEAETVSLPAMEYLRRICDLAHVGFVLTGTLRLEAMIRHPEGRFGQVSSRIGFWPAQIRSITEDDCRKLVNAALADEMEDIGKEEHAAFWEGCDGSARVLGALIQGVRDYVIRKKDEPDAKAIRRICRDVLGFQARQRTAFAGRARPPNRVFEAMQSPLGNGGLPMEAA